MSYEPTMYAMIDSAVKEETMFNVWGNKWVSFDRYLVWMYTEYNKEGINPIAMGNTIAL